jgi:HSP20 family protein
MKKDKQVVVAKGKEIQKVTPARAVPAFDEMDRLMERIFGEFPRRGWMRPWSARWPAWPEMPELQMPKVDVLDRDDDVVVRAELPGVDKKDIEISTNATSVTIKATRQHEEKEEKGDYYRCEISRGACARTVALPAEVENEKAKASLKDGVLELTLPKIKKSKRKAITID